MNDRMAAYLDSLVEEVFQSEKFSQTADSEKEVKKSQIMDRLNAVIIQTLVDHLDEGQLKRFNAINLDSEEEASMVIQQLAMEVPHFYLMADEVLKKEVAKMIGSGLIDQLKPESSEHNPW